MKKIAIKLTNISKKYVLHHKKPTLSESLLGNTGKKEFWALKDINLTINKGERIGIIGKNGAGKTTLLEIIAGITTPTSGTIKSTGKIISLIELGAGFHPDLSGTENIYLNGLLIGMTRKEAHSKLTKIVNYADIGQFIHAPLYTYSSGMALRLGFAIAIHSNFDTLLLDEHLSVGDSDFKKKATQTIINLFKQKKTIIIASHQLEFLKENCTQIIWLEKGGIKLTGTPPKVIKSYNS